MKKHSARKLTLSGLFLALGLLLPFLTGQIPTIGKMLLPMHIPVLLAGFVCGWPYGLIVGLICPVLRSVLPMMSAGPWLLNWLPMALRPDFIQDSSKKNQYIYVALIVSMIFGRIVWAISSLVFYQIMGSAFTWEMFMAEAFINALPE